MRLIFLLCLSVFSIYGAGQIGQLDPGGIVRINNGVELNMALSPVTVEHNGFCYTVTCSEASCATKTLYAPTTSNDEMETFVNNIGQNVSGISVTSVSGTCGGSYSWDYEVPASASCEYGCLKLGNLRCKNSSGAFVADSECDSILVSKPVADSKYIADSSCGAQSALVASEICSPLVFTGYKCINGSAATSGSYNIGGNSINGHPYESPSLFSVSGSKLTGTMYDKYNQIGHDCDILNQGPHWIYSGNYGSCQADCMKYEGRTCSTGNPADCPLELIPSIACSPGDGLCPASCTYPSNVSSISQCNDACPSGPTKMCQVGNNDATLISCPFGEPCNCQAFSGCLGAPSCHCRDVPVSPSDVCAGDTIRYPDSCGNSFACPVTGTAGPLDPCLSLNPGPVGGGGGGGGGCFVAETLIDLKDGVKSYIRDIKIGDEVMSINGSSNKVTDTISFLHKGYKYSINGSEHFVTASHPFKSVAGWKSFDPNLTKIENPDLKVGKLQVGSILIKTTGLQVIYFIDRVYREEMVYNITVDNEHEYIADDFAVHNKEQAP